MNTTTATRRTLLYTTLFLLTIAALSLDARADARGVVNINTATYQQLLLLPGIGPKLASEINDYKEACCDHQQGARAAFKRVEDLAKVPGFGKARIAKLRPFVVLEGATTARKKIKLGTSDTKSAPAKPAGRRRCPQGARC